MKRSYKYRIYPNKAQLSRLEYSLDLLRDFYNAGLQERRDAWKLNRVRVTCFDQIRQIADIRNLLNTDYQAVQFRTLAQTLRKLDKTFQSFFRRLKTRQNPGFPRFKGKVFFNSIIYNQSGYRFRDGKLNISLIGDLKIKLSRPFEGKIKEVVLKREGSKWFAILSCDGVPKKPLTAAGSAIGIDAGIESFITLSDETQVENPRFYQSTQKRLRKAQRKLSRRKKGSNRRRKAAKAVAEIHRKIFRQREDFHHKLSTDLVKHHDLIAVENLNTKGLCQMRLSKQIHDVGWSGFFDKIAYKAESADRRFVKVNPAGTSQTCVCGERVEKKLSVRWHECLKCGLSNHRDIVSAQIILLRGLRSQHLTHPVAESVC